MSATGQTPSFRPIDPDYGRTDASPPDVDPSQTSVRLAAKRALSSEAGKKARKVNFNNPLERAPAPTREDAFPVIFTTKALTACFTAEEPSRKETQDLQALEGFLNAPPEEDRVDGELSDQEEEVVEIISKYAPDLSRKEIVQQVMHYTESVPCIQQLLENNRLILEKYQKTRQETASLTTENLPDQSRELAQTSQLSLDPLIDKTKKTRDDLNKQLNDISFPLTAVLNRIAPGKRSYLRIEEAAKGSPLSAEVPPPCPGFISGTKMTGVDLPSLLDQLSSHFSQSGKDAVAYVVQIDKKTYGFFCRESHVEVFDPENCRAALIRGTHYRTDKYARITDARGQLWDSCKEIPISLKATPLFRDQRVQKKQVRELEETGSDPQILAQVCLEGLKDAINNDIDPDRHFYLDYLQRVFLPEGVNVGEMLFNSLVAVTQEAADLHATQLPLIKNELAEPLSIQLKSILSSYCDFLRSKHNAIIHMLETPTRIKPLPDVVASILKEKYFKTGIAPEEKIKIRQTFLELAATYKMAIRAAPTDESLKNLCSQFLADPRFNGEFGRFGFRNQFANGAPIPLHFDRDGYLFASPLSVLQIQAITRTRETLFLNF